MGVVGKVWNIVASIIKVNDKLVQMADTLKEHKRNIESLNERVLRLEIALQYMTVQPSGDRRSTQRSIPPAQG